MTWRKRWIRFRIWLARKIDPWPDVGEGWCIDCSLHEKETMILPESGVERHIQRHREVDGSEYLKLRWSQPGTRARTE